MSWKREDTGYLAAIVGGTVTLAWLVVWNLGFLAGFGLGGNDPFPGSREAPHLQTLTPAGAVLHDPIDPGLLAALAGDSTPVAATPAPATPAPAAPPPPPAPPAPAPPAGAPATLGGVVEDVGGAVVSVVGGTLGTVLDTVEQTVEVVGTTVDVVGDGLVSLTEATVEVVTSLTTGVIGLVELLAGGLGRSLRALIAPA